MLLISLSRSTWSSNTGNIMNSMDDGSSFGLYTNYLNGVANITFYLSRSSVLGGSGVLWVAFLDGSPDPYGHMALQPYGVADWFHHFMRIAPLFIID